MEIAALVISILALIGSGVSAFAAVRSSNAARKSAENSGISAKAAANADERAQAEADAKRVVFVFEETAKHRYVLRNEGTNIAYGVKLGNFDPAEPTRFDGPRSFEQAPPGFAERYDIIDGWGSRTNSFEIEWHFREDRQDPVQRKRLLVERRLH